MRFHVNLFNHHDSTRHTLDDPFLCIVGMMRALGHTVGRSETGFLQAKDGLNIVVEGFTPWSAEIIQDLHAKGHRFVLLATEEPTPLGFNHGIDPKMVERQAMLEQMKGLFEGVLHLVSGDHVTAWYNQIAPAAHVELGWAPGLERFTSEQPDHAFGFYGGGVTSLSRRYQILKKLGAKTPHKNAVKVITGYKMTVAERDREMRRAKIIVQIRTNEKMGLLSNSRCSTSLLIGRPVIAEPHDLAGHWSEVIQVSKSEAAFYGDAVAALPLWRQIHAGQFSRFKRIFTPEFCLGEPLKHIGIEAHRIAA